MRPGTDQPLGGDHCRNLSSRMDPPHPSAHTVHPTIVQHEYLEMVPPIATVDQHHDLPRHLDPLPHHGKDASPAQLRHHQELNRGDVPMLEEKVERWRTHGIPQHPIWQFFTHAHATHKQTRHAPHLATSVHNHMDVTCSFCGAHVHQDHTLHKGEDEPIAEIAMVSSVLHGMWKHLETQCPHCPANVRRDMMTWRPLPKESRTTPAAPTVSVVTKGGPESHQGFYVDQNANLAHERNYEAGGCEDDTESHDTTSYNLGPSEARP